jgi:metal-sulfur cluster biosynthetic enzyme
MPAEDDVREELKDVIDPELGINIVDLGLLYDIDMSDDGNLGEDGDKTVHVLMTLTTPGCPLHEVFRDEVKDKTARLDGIAEEDVDVELTFDPPWSREKMSDQARADLGFI